VAQVSGGVGLGRPDVNHLGAAQASDGEFAQEEAGVLLDKKASRCGLKRKIVPSLTLSIGLTSCVFDR